MIPQTDLDNLAAARLEDAQALLTTGRFDGAVYLCGYAVELKLKSRICRTLGWAGFPSTRGEFDGYQSFRTHDLDVLLRLSGIESQVKSRYIAEWSVVATWEPELRYRLAASSVDAVLLVHSVRSLLEVL
jgi:hypothetical protein